MSTARSLEVAELRVFFDEMKRLVEFGRRENFECDICGMRNSANEAAPCVMTFLSKLLPRFRDSSTVPKSPSTVLTVTFR